MVVFKEWKYTLESAWMSTICIFKVICMYVGKEICIESLWFYFRTIELEQKIELPEW